jgi:hypothetical protein
MKSIKIIAIIALTMSLNASDEVIKKPSTFQSAYLAYKSSRQSSGNDSSSSIVSPDTDTSSLSGSANFSAGVSLNKPRNLSFKQHKNFVGFMYGIYRDAALTEDVVQKSIGKVFAKRLEQEDVWSYSKYAISTLNPEVQAIVRENSIDGFECNYIRDKAMIQIKAYGSEGFKSRKNALEDKNKPFFFYVQE